MSIKIIRNTKSESDLYIKNLQTQRFKSVVDSYNFTKKNFFNFKGYFAVKKTDINCYYYSHLYQGASVAGHFAVALSLFDML